MCVGGGKAPLIVYPECVPIVSPSIKPGRKYVLVYEYAVKILGAHTPYLQYYDPVFIVLQGIMVVYDVTNLKTFENISGWMEDIERVCHHYTFVCACMRTSGVSAEVAGELASVSLGGW